MPIFTGNKLPHSAHVLLGGRNQDFDGLDTDSDGKVTKKEFQEYAKGRLPDFDQLKKFADRVDADKDGTISEDEFDGRMEALQALSQEMQNGGDTKKKKTKKETEMADQATKAFNAMTKLVSQGDWEKVPKGMTKTGKRRLRDGHGNAKHHTNENGVAFTNGCAGSQSSQRRDN